MNKLLWYLFQAVVLTKMGPLSTINNAPNEMLPSTMRDSLQQVQVKWDIPSMLKAPSSAFFYWISD